jgi:CRISPR-associated protein Csb2
MARQTLIVALHFLDGRYHGSGDWPPSPFRLFQALVAAAYIGRDAADKEIDALRWLESLAPPIIVTPKARQSTTTTYFVPRNGADAARGDLLKASKNRDPKLSRPWLFDESVPFLYLWSFDDDEQYASTIVLITESLYQFGRGIDMAFAVTEIVGADAAEQFLLQHPGSIYRPNPKGSANTLPCPKKHYSFNSLLKRHQAQLIRLRNGEFRKAPPPIFEKQGYNCPTVKLLYDVVENTPAGNFAAQPLITAASFAEKVRDQAASRLKTYFSSEQVDRFVVGCNADDGDKALRIRIIPLPSIGFIHTHQDIRRFLVEIPPDCPISTDDIAWAFSGLNLGIDYETGEIFDNDAPILTSTDDRKMLEHYGVENGKEARIWRTVTPVALPIDKQCGKIHGTERAFREGALAYAARQALRHAGLDAKTEILRVQREPFDSKGACADEFAHGKRFPATRLYHLEIAFREPVSGPIVIGNGRYLGLGLMHPLPEPTQNIFILSLAVQNRPAITNQTAFLEAVRRALISRARDLLGCPGRLFSGHECDGAPARSGQHEHVFLAAEDVDDDGLIDRLLVVAPWQADRSYRSNNKERLEFERIVSSLETVRAGRLGVFRFETPASISPDDWLFSLANKWISITPYEPTRFPKSEAEIQEEIITDLVKECYRRGLPKPSVEILSIQTGPRGGVRAEARLIFAVAVCGPLMLGRNSHKGGGLFRAEN